VTTGDGYGVPASRSNAARGIASRHDFSIMTVYGTTFDRRVRNIGIAQVRTPFRSPRANAIAVGF
jgi:hypothetical protein